MKDNNQSLQLSLILPDGNVGTVFIVACKPDIVTVPEFHAVRHGHSRADGKPEFRGRELFSSLNLTRRSFLETRYVKFVDCIDHDGSCIGEVTSPDETGISFLQFFVLHYC